MDCIKFFLNENLLCPCPYLLVGPFIERFATQRLCIFGPFVCFDSSGLSKYLAGRRLMAAERTKWLAEAINSQPSVWGHGDAVFHGRFLVFILRGIGWNLQNREIVSSTNLFYFLKFFWRNYFEQFSCKVADKVD